MTNSETATIRYRLHLPHALHPISPALSALHTSRAAALHPDTVGLTHCPKCGTFYFSGDRPSCPSTKKKQRPKASRRNCHVCGFSVDVRVVNRSALSEAPRTKEISQEPRPTAGTTKPVPSTHHKKSTLKDMLSRNREREDLAKSQKKKKEGHEGLTAFLKEL